MSRIKISPATAVTCDDDFQIIENAAIHIEDQRITFVGSASTAPAFDADEEFGGAHLVALPGLINTHGHAAMTLMRGLADDMALEVWLQTKIWPFERNLDGDDVYWGTSLAIAEMLRGGTTTFADMYFYYERGAQAIEESGTRACPGGVLLGFLPEAEKRLANAIAFVREFSGAAKGRITPFLAPHSLYTCDRKQWETMIGAARELGVLIHTHASETPREVAEVTAQWGASPIQTLKNIGALDSHGNGGGVLAAHCVHVDEADLEIMASHDFRVAHNPTSNLKLASGFAPVPEFLKRKILVGLATDSAASNNNLDLWEEMRLAALIHKATSGDPTAISAREALLMATREGARCLNLETQIGSLQVGKKADVILMDFDKPHLTPRHNVVSHLVYAAHSSDVNDVIVDGKVLVRSGELVCLDAARVGARARESAARLAQLAQ
jgi:5-methylthioadenosine/S-adenosylhomocysteine deaminase